MVTEEIASVCGREVPSFGSVKVLGFTPSADQLGEILVVWVVVKGADILAPAHHVLHVRGVVDWVRIRQRSGSRKVRGSCVCPLVSFETCRLQDERLVFNSSPRRASHGTLGARGDVRVVRVDVTVAVPGGVPHPLLLGLASPVQLPAGTPWWTRGTALPYRATASPGND